jgi:hypothetical protein
MIKQTDICSYGLKDSFIREHIQDISEPDLEQVNKCREYIKQFLKYNRRGHSSYGLKHSVEAYYKTYISNGSFIMAALLEGCNIERFNLSSPNARIFLDYKKNYKKVLN